MEMEMAAFQSNLRTVTLLHLQQPTLLPVQLLGMERSRVYQQPISSSLIILLHQMVVVVIPKAVRVVMIVSA
jgi:hypothetical protein